jgi:hypothetical protein
MNRKRALLATVIVIVLGAVAAALVSRDHSTSSDSTAPGGASGGASGGGGTSAAEPASLEGATDTAARQPTVASPMSRAVISTGQVTLSADDPEKARSEIVRMVASWGGSVADEQSSSDRHGRLADSTLTLRVPSDHFAEAMTAFGGLGHLEQRSQKSEDVTTKVLDVDARVRAGERSIQQIEALLSRAQKLGDIIAIENDLARRQADLDSLKSQQAWLEDQTSLSTITVQLSRPMPPAPAEARGFLAGLENGWQALGSTMVAALTAVGAVLPFAVLVALLGVPLWLVVRRRRVGATPVAGA